MRTLTVLGLDLPEPLRQVGREVEHYGLTAPPRGALELFARVRLTGRHNKSVRDTLPPRFRETPLRSNFESWLLLAGCRFRGARFDRVEERRSS